VLPQVHNSNWANIAIDSAFSRIRLTQLMTEIGFLIYRNCAILHSILDIPSPDLPPLTHSI